MFGNNSILCSVAFVTVVNVPKSSTETNFNNSFICVCALSIVISWSCVILKHWFICFSSNSMVKHVWENWFVVSVSAFGVSGVCVATSVYVFGSNW